MRTTFIRRSEDNFCGKIAKVFSVSPADHTNLHPKNQQHPAGFSVNSGMSFLSFISVPYACFTDSLSDFPAVNFGTRIAGM